jgi:hypothetical protein
MPAILEGLDLARRSLALRVGEDEVVVFFGVERRVKIDQVNGLVLQVPSYHLKVVAEI